MDTEAMTSIQPSGERAAMSTATTAPPSAARARPLRSPRARLLPRRPDTSGLPPGPRSPRPLQTLLLWQHTVPFLASNLRRYGPVFTIRAMPWGTAVVVNDAELVKQVFTGDANVFHAGEGNSMLAPVLGERSVLVIDEDEHLQARKRLLPPFHGEAVQRYGDIVERIVDEEIA